MYSRGYNPLILSTSRTSQYTSMMLHCSGICEKNMCPLKVDHVVIQMSMIKINCWPWECAFFQCAMFGFPTCTIQIAQSQVNTSWMVTVWVYHNGNATNGSFPSLCDITGHYQKLIEFIERVLFTNVLLTHPLRYMFRQINHDKSTVSNRSQKTWRSGTNSLDVDWSARNKQQSVTKKHLHPWNTQKKSSTRLTGYFGHRFRPVFFVGDPT